MFGVSIGGMYIADGTSEQTGITTATKLTLWEGAMPGYRNTNPDYTTNNRITVNSSGLYMVTFNATFFSDAVNDQNFLLYKNGSVVGYGFASTAEAETADDYLNVSFAGVLNLVAGDYLEIYMVASTESDITVEQAQLLVYSIGPQKTDP